MEAESLVRDIKLSTVVPASITGEEKDLRFTGLDLALKLHFITTVHFFGGDAAAALTIDDYKKPMFQLLQLYYPISGRLRRLDGGGRPFIKCNDSGVRIVEATCSKVMAEWLATVEGGDHHRLLVYDQPLLAHDFGFTPLVFLQLTRFQCGGLCVGMRWAHILGGAFAASEFINMWGKIMANQTAPPQFLSPPTSMKRQPPTSPPSLTAAKVLEPVGDNWLVPNNSELQTHTFHITEKHLIKMKSRERNKYKAEPFEIISAIVWKSMAKIKGTNIITVCKNTKHEELFELPSNAYQVICVVEAETKTLIMNTDPLEIAQLIAEKFVDQTSVIEEAMEAGKGLVDMVVYGANLTFLNFEGVDVYGLQLKGQRPVFGNVSIGGVGDEGAVVVVVDSSGGGRIVNAILPEDELHHLKNELRVDWDIV